MDIYDGLFADLSEAVTAIASGGAIGLGDADPIYHGDELRWQRFANSLRARHAMRLANVDATKARAEITAAMAAPGGLIASNDDNARMVWPGDGVYDNPWSANNQGRDDHRLSDRLMGQMLPFNDPRVCRLCAADAVLPDDGPAGCPASPTRECRTRSRRRRRVTTRSLLRGRERFSIPRTGSAMAAQDSPDRSFPNFIMTYAEVSFILAEAAERGWIAGSAAAYYLQGIQASMEQWGVTDAAAIAAYIAQPGIAYTPGVAGLRQIALQKWIALYTDGVEAWAEWRRTCVPTTVVPGPDAVINTVPRRYQYSTREHSVNSANLDAAVARQGADEFTTRMYWDSNPTAAPTYPGPSCGVRP